MHLVASEARLGEKAFRLPLDCFKVAFRLLLGMLASKGGARVE